MSNQELVTIEQERKPALANLSSFMLPKETIASVQVQSVAMAVEILAKIIVADSAPRDLANWETRMLAHCADLEFAEKAVSIKPIGDGIEVPSVHLAKTMAAEYGHVKMESIDHGGEKTSQIDVRVWDLQKNVEFQTKVAVRHKMKAHGSIKTVEDPQEIRQLVKAEMSKTERNELFSMMPPGARQRFFEACLETLDLQSGEFMKDKAACLKVYTEKFGVNIGQLCSWLKIKEPKELKPHHVRRMQALGGAIKNHEVNPAEIFVGAKDVPTRAAKQAGKATVPAVEDTTTETKGEEKPNEETKTTEKTGGKEKGKGGAKNKGASGAQPDSSTDKESDKVDPQPEGSGDSTPETSGLDEGESEPEGADDDSADGDGDGDDDSGELPSAVGAPSEEKKAAIKQMFE